MSHVKLARNGTLQHSSPAETGVQKFFAKEGCAFLSFVIIFFSFTVGLSSSFFVHLRPKVQQKKKRGMKGIVIIVQ